MSRPTKLTPEIHEDIVKDISNGITFIDASGAAGIDYATFNNWMKRGEVANNGIYFEFFQSCKVAKAQARKKFTLVIAKASFEGDWRAALEYLKRHDPENWGDRQDVNLKAETNVIIKWDGTDGTSND